MFQRDFVILRSPRETLRIRRVTAASRSSAEAEAAARRAIALIRFGLETRDPTVLEAAQRLLHVVDGQGGFEPRALRLASSAGSLLGEIERRLVLELKRGRLVVEVITEPGLQVRDEVPEVALPPLPPARREGPETFYEVTFVDEIGQSISGIAVDFEAPGDARGVTTNAGGVALVEGVTSFSATVAVSELEALEQALDPRWQTLRAGRFPRESNQSAVFLDGSPIGPVSVRPAVPNTVVVQPVFGDLLLELADKRSRIRHKRRPYRISGPVALSGETDERGLVNHPRVPNGDYLLELDVEIDLGEPSPEHEIFTTPAVVLAAADETAQFRGLGALPQASLLRLKGLVFDTNKAFLLPSALPSLGRLRQVLLAHNPGKLLIVGHTDTTGEPDYNEKLSLTRARSMAAFLKDDVAKWLEFYETSLPEEQRWGAHEDAQMLLSLPDFEQKPAREEPIRWFQRTRLLGIDGVAGPETRTQLIKEYMQRDGVSLAEDPDLDLEITCHGCGENFPLDDSGENLDSAPPDDREDALDRRVELYLFDPEFGIQPPPPGEISKAGSAAYPAWRKRAELALDLEGLGRRITIRILDDADAPQDGAEYRVRVGREVHLGKAKEGVVELVSAAGETRCLLEWTPSGGEPLPIAGGKPTHVTEVFVTPVGAADPETAERMLHNLGYSSSFGLDDAVFAFQSDQGLDETGELDAATTARLDAVYAELSEI